MQKKLLTILASLMLVISLSPVTPALAAQAHSNSYAVFTAVGAHQIYTCPNGKSIQDLGVSWLSGNICSAGYNLDGKRYVSGEEHINHLKTNLTNVIKRNVPGYSFIAATNYSQPSFDFDYDGKRFESIVGTFEFRNQSSHYATVSDVQGGQLTINGLAEKWISPGETVTVSCVPDDGYALVPGSIQVVQTCGSTADVAVSDDGSFTMPDACVSVTADFAPTHVMHTAVALNVKVVDHNGAVQSSSQQWGSAAGDFVSYDEIPYIVGGLDNPDVQSAIQQMIDEANVSADQLHSTASYENQTVQIPSNDEFNDYQQCIVNATLTLKGHWISTQETEHGHIAVSSNFANAEDDLKIQFVPAEGYMLKKGSAVISLIDSAAEYSDSVEIGENGSVVMPMPNSCLSISASFVPVPLDLPGVSEDEKPSTPHDMVRIVPIIAEQETVSAASVADEPSPSPIEAISNEIDHLVENAGEEAIAVLVSGVMAVVGVGCAAGALFALRPPR